MRAVVVVGLSWGDEAKGAWTDFLVRDLKAQYVVRYSGGYQAAHNVVLPDGRKHAFSQFGAGTFAGAKTRLLPPMLLNLERMLVEADKLRALAVANPEQGLEICEDCVLVLRQHVYLNRTRELVRGENRHGSCGNGIGVTREFMRDHPDTVVRVSDVLGEPETLLYKIERLDALVASLGANMTVRTCDTARQLQQHLAALQQRGATIVKDELPNCRVAVFEGAQGTLLDEWYGTHPYTTWGSVTAREIAARLRQAGHATTVLGLTRSYATRHGVGPFPTESLSASEEDMDPNNVTNAWQGALRNGWLDLELLRYAAAVNQVDGICVSHLDHRGLRGSWGAGGHAFFVNMCYTNHGVPLLEWLNNLSEEELRHPEMLYGSALTWHLMRAKHKLQLRGIKDAVELFKLMNDNVPYPIVGTADGPTYESRRWYGMRGRHILAGKACSHD